MTEVDFSEQQTVLRYYERPVMPRIETVLTPGIVKKIL